jgi:5,10-methylenetetrahydromethanopterin reductase
MAVPFRIGVLQLSMEPVNETLRMATACEAAGFDTFWLAEAYPWWRKHGMEARSSTAITALIAKETQRIGIGWGIISPYTRHPIQIAMEARVMQDLCGEGRFLLGLGASKIFMREIGEGEGGSSREPGTRGPENVAPEDGAVKNVLVEKGAGEKGSGSAAPGPATVMRESLEIVRGMLSGELFEFNGKAFSASVPGLRKGAHASRARVPMYIGATGPMLQRLAGSHADGLLTASITTPAFVRYSRQFMEEGARKAGKDPASLDLGSVIVGSISRDKAHAKDGAREMAAMYLANKVQNIRGSADMLLQNAGLTFDEIQPIAAAMETGGRQAAARAVSDEVLAKVCPIAGTPGECIEALEQYRQAGCTHIMLELWGEKREEQAWLFGDAVLPHFRR